MRYADVLIFFLSPAVAVAEIHVLGEPVDLADSVNPTSTVSWDADGDGTEELVAYDPLKQRITVSKIGAMDFPSLVFPISQTRAFAKAEVIAGKVFKAEVNGDGVPDLILAGSGRVDIWYGTNRDASLLQAPDWAWNFPVTEFYPVEFLPPADLDGDGSPDFVSTLGTVFIFGIGTENPTHGDGGGLEEGAPQIVANWDGAGKTVLAIAPFRQGITRVYEIPATRTFTEIDSVPAEGTFVSLSGNFPPELVEVRTTGETAGPLANVYTKAADSWTPVALDYPAGLSSITYVPPFRKAVLKSVRTPGTESLAFVSDDAELILIEQGDTSPEVRLARTRSDTDTTSNLRVLSLSVLVLQGTAENALAVTFTRIPMSSPVNSFIFPGTIQGTALTVIRLQESFPHKVYRENDILRGFGPIAKVLSLDVDSDGRLDLLALRMKTHAISTFHQPGHAASTVSSSWLPGITNPEDIVKGSFTSRSSTQIAVSGFGGTSIYSLDSGSPVKVGDIRPGGILLASGDLNGNGSEEILLIDEQSETLNHSGSLNPIALAGRTPPSPLGGLDGSFPLTEPAYITGDQILVTDADGDGDNDIITFPSALGQTFGLHRNDAGRFSIQHMTSEPVPDIFGVSGTTIDGVLVGNPTQIFLGRFLRDSSNKTLGVYSPGFDFFGNSISGFTVFSGLPSQSTAVASTSIATIGTVVVTDFDGDGLDDVISSGKRTTDLLGNTLFSNSLVFQRAIGDGTFESGVYLGSTLKAEVSQLLAEDMNGDGLPDIIAISEEAGSVQLFLSGTVPFHPSFEEWITAHSPSAPGELDIADESGIPNLIRFATGTVPANSTSQAPPAPPVRPKIEFNGFSITAFHPIPQLPAGDALDVKLEYSLDLGTWQQAEDPFGLLNDPDHPQWKYKDWSYTSLKDTDGNTIRSPEKIFFRFAITYIPGS